MSKKYTYHRGFTFTDVEGNTKHNIATQLYKIGVYVITDNDTQQQGSITPARMVKMGKDLDKALEDGLIKDLEKFSTITVHEVDGFWEEVDD